jgi:hypothetical protein
LGGKLCIFPNHIHEKDINAMILADREVTYIEDIIKKNTFSDLEARLKLNQWKKT